MAKRTRWYVSTLRTFHGRLWEDTKISFVSMFDGDTESMRFIGEGNSTTSAWPVNMRTLGQREITLDTINGGKAGSKTTLQLKPKRAR